MKPQLKDKLEAIIEGARPIDSYENLLIKFLDGRTGDNENEKLELNKVIILKSHKILSLLDPLLLQIIERDKLNDK